MYFNVNSLEKSPRILVSDKNTGFEATATLCVNEVVLLCDVVLIGGSSRHFL